MFIGSHTTQHERLKSYKLMKFPIKEVRTDGTVIFDDPEGEGVSEQFSRGNLLEIFSWCGLKVEKIVDAGIAYICLISRK